MIWIRIQIRITSYVGIINYHVTPLGLGPGPGPGPSLCCTLHYPVDEETFYLGHSTLCTLLHYTTLYSTLYYGMDWPWLTRTAHSREK